MIGSALRIRNIILICIISISWNIKTFWEASSGDLPSKGIIKLAIWLYAMQCSVKIDQSFPTKYDQRLTAEK
ncbi:unnamed protein product [Ceratitis capitata]|uniref:(Mediterranean fruit fly) hypothetical protein n=1 Tax=Ceratitis capitata TaxID=7213 RepID=A0A811V4V3_CERCA|nr:unnamed protein product [Ceratitis capitata]